MKKIILIITFFIITSSTAAEKINMKNCKTILSKLKPNCIKFLNNTDGFFKLLTINQ